MNEKWNETAENGGGVASKKNSAPNGCGVTHRAAEVGQRRMGLYAVDTLWNGCAGAAEKNESEVVWMEMEAMWLMSQSQRSCT